jgi:putative peptidoglycan lipid II flippase
LTRGSVSRKIFGAATVVAALTLVTQLGSIARELTVAAWFGTEDCLDAFLIAFLLPLFVINVVAGSFNAAFIPTFIQVTEKKDFKVAQELFSSIMTWSIGLLIFVSLLLAFFAPYYLPILGSGFSAAKLQMARYMLLFLLPVVFFKGLSNIWAGVLNAEERLSFN